MDLKNKDLDLTLKQTRSYKSLDILLNEDITILIPNIKGSRIYAFDKPKE